MIDVRPYDDLAAMAILQRLDPSDHLEAELSRGAPATALALFADWRSMQAIRVISHVAFTCPTRGGKPFALFAVAQSGYAGVGEAALLARDHARFRRPLAELALVIRRGIGAEAARLGIHRIGCRSWSDHPTAARLLEAIGFRHECDMPGFGRSGTVTFRQFAWTAPELLPVLQPACRPHLQARN
ncbi:GNAT family N-acetyltransferase [Cereibacter azotoformans]|uniref:GNAT family N-acetyltransferase n=1 Tax=Cereibacter azotoformans TaxID=43057 RepID=UPI000C6D7F1F|nr:GNAT family protein [Cereibacter azotoformans]